MFRVLDKNRRRQHGQIFAYTSYVRYKTDLVVKGLSRRLEGRCELLLRPPIPRAAAKLFLRYRIGAKNISVRLTSYKANKSKK